MKRILTFKIVIITLLILNSCGDTQPGSGMLPNVSGSSGEVLVIVDRALWEGQLGEKLREVIAAPIDKLPQAEPSFDLLNVTPAAFSKLYQTHRNVIFIDIKSENEPRITFQENTYANSQLLINIEGKDEKDIINLIENEGSSIINKINIAERDRWIKVYKQSLNSVIFNKLREDHNLSLGIPANFSLDVEEDGFLWFSYETPNTTQAILIHYFDHTDENYFNKDSIIRIRNGLTRKKVEGPAEGSYMTIEKRVPVDFDMFRFRQRNYAEMRGLWTLENGYMGGPFVNLVTRDEVNDRFVMIDGFVYAPRDDKRELLRQVEAIMYTLTFPDETEVVVKPGK